MSVRWLLPVLLALLLLPAFRASDDEPDPAPAPREAKNAADAKQAAEAAKLKQELAATRQDVEELKKALATQTTAAEV